MAFEQEGVLLAFSKGILEAMAAKGVTRAELARQTNRSPQAVSRALKGSQNLTVGTMVELAFALDHAIAISVAPLAGLKGIAKPTSRRALRCPQEPRT
jgi:transcriptional regulator with XRE-family HTH domain